MEHCNEFEPVQPLQTGYGPASVALRGSTALESQHTSQGRTVSLSAGSQGDSDPDSSGQPWSAAKTSESDRGGLSFGLDGTTGPASGDGGQDDQAGEGEPSRRGNWGHGRPMPWTDEQDLELLRILQEQPDWIAQAVTDELNRRFPNEPNRSVNATRQRTKTLVKKGVTLAGLEAKCGGKQNDSQDGKEDGSGGAAGGVTSTIGA